MNLGKLWNKRKYFKSLKQKTLFFYIILFGFSSIVFVVSFSIILRRTNSDYRARTSETAVNNVVSTVNSTVQNLSLIHI